MSVDKLDVLKVPLEDLKGIKPGEIRKFDFDEGVTLPARAILQTDLGEGNFIGKNVSSTYCGGRLIGEYRITGVN